MKRIYCAAVALGVLVGCASEEKPASIEVEPVHGSVVHPTAVESQEYAPEARVVRVPKLEQYMVRGTWHWDKPEQNPEKKCGGGCPVKTKPDIREVQRQQLPEG